MFDGQYIKGGPGSATWNPGREETYVIITNIVKDLLTVLPGVEVIHLGGDEVSKTKCWGSDPYVQQFMKDKGLKDLDEMFSYFLKEIARRVKKETGKKIMWWGEAGANVEREPDNIMQFWTDSSGFKEFYSKYPLNPKVVSVYDKFYYDVGYGNRYFSHLSNKIYNTWSQQAIFEPTRHLGVNIDDTVIGGEATLFSELVNDDIMWERIFPRIFLTADTFWGSKKPVTQDWLNYVQSLVKVMDFFDSMGVPSEKITSRYCL